ncbi:MAG TPA: DUF5134 domain-containing protein [Pseudonocardia sp.]|nr:DUF5134 domain-containing protein [Pseudonocardia sp.]
MTGSAVLDHTLFVALVAAAAMSAVLLLLERRRTDPAGSHLSGPEADGAHLVMNAAMAVTLTPLFAGPGRTAVVAVFVLLAGGFAVALVVGIVGRSGYWSARRTLAGYHLAAAAVMAFAAVSMHHATGGTSGTGGIEGMAGMAGMGDMAGMPGMDHAGAVSAAPGVVAWILAVLFALDAIGTAVTVAVLPAGALAAVAPPATAQTAAPQAAPSGLAGPAAAVPDSRSPGWDPATVRRLRLSSVPHVVMDVAMVLMLVGAAIR